MNVVHLIGRVGRNLDPLRTTGNNNPVVNIALATDEVFNDREGKVVKRAEWHRLVLFGRLAEIASQYLHQGDQVGIEGKLQTRSWRDRTGAAQKTTEVVVTRLHLLGKNQNATDPLPGDRSRETGEENSVF